MAASQEGMVTSVDPFGALVGGLIIGFILGLLVGFQVSRRD